MHSITSWDRVIPTLKTTDPQWEQKTVENENPLTIPSTANCDVGQSPCGLWSTLSANSELIFNLSLNYWRRTNRPWRPSHFYTLAIFPVPQPWSRVLTWNVDIPFTSTDAACIIEFFKQFSDVYLIHHEVLPMTKTCTWNVDLKPGSPEKCHQ